MPIRGIGEADDAPVPLGAPGSLNSKIRSLTVGFASLNKGGSGFITSQFDVTSGSAVKIADFNEYRRALLVQNLGEEANVYVGNAGVTTLTGMRLLPGDTFTIEVQAAVYAISPSSNRVAVCEVWS